MMDSSAVVGELVPNNVHTGDLLHLWHVSARHVIWMFGDSAPDSLIELGKVVMKVIVP
jgi:sorbitol-specific phosphotransferase system component IIA